MDSKQQDFGFLLEHVGKRIGSVVAKGEMVLETYFFYVYDGKVYSQVGTTSPTFVYEYFEFCEKLRQGEFPNFVPSNCFHLRGNG